MSVSSSIHLISLPTPFPVGPVNVYLLREDPVTLVDVGPNTAEAWETLEEALRRAGVRWRDIQYIVITHPHVDHHGLLGRVAEASGAEVLVHPDARRRVMSPALAAEDQIRFFHGFLTSAGVPPEIREVIWKHQRYLRDHAEGVDQVESISEGREVFLGGRRWQVIDTPGHSSGHLSLFDAVTGEMIAGDHVLPHISSNALLEPPKEPGTERPRSLLIYIEALRKVAEMPVEKVYPGHGDPFRGVAELVNRRMEGYERRCSQLLAWLREGPLTIYELVRRMFPKLERSGYFLGVSEIVGHLDLLQIRGEVRVEERKGIWYYRADAPLVTGNPAVRDRGR